MDPAGSLEIQDIRTTAGRVSMVPDTNLSSQTLKYTPPPGWTGTATITYTVVRGLLRREMSMEVVVSKPYGGGDASVSSRGDVGSSLRFRLNVADLDTPEDYERQSQAVVESEGPDGAMLKLWRVSL